MNLQKLLEILMKILIVEDSVGQRRLIHKVIRKNEAHETITAEDAFDAYVILKAIAIDVVILDNDMPYATGMNLLSKLKDSQNFPLLKVIMMSADDEYENF